MNAYALRPGDVKVPVSSPVSSLKGNDFQEYRVEFWLVSGDESIQGVGFTIHGRRSTDFLTWSSSNPIHVWTEDGQVQVISGFCTRGLGLPKDEASRFMVAWLGNPAPDKETPKVMGGVFANYQRSQRASPPKTYAMAEVAQTDWGKKVAKTLFDAKVI